MIDIRRQEDHFHHNRAWLETDWHFSFGEYRDPDNTNFGPLRVVNNDKIDGGGGFPMHSHEDMEILTWVIEGEIVHEDSTGTKERIGRNGLQKMSAGTGISHSEYNGSDTDMLHLLQIWIEPETMGVEPSYEDATFSGDQLNGTFYPVASGDDGAPVNVEQDTTLFVAHLDSGDELSRELDPRRRAYVVVMTGTVDLAETSLREGDALRITDEAELNFEATSHVELMLIDLP